MSIEYIDGLDLHMFDTHFKFNNFFAKNRENSIPRLAPSG